MQNKNFSNAVLILILAIIAGAVGYLIYRTRPEQKPVPQQAPTTKNGSQPTTTPSADHPVDPGTLSYDSTALKIHFHYPKDIFQVAEAPGRVILESPYHVIENFKGTPDGEFKHPFAIGFRVEPTDMVTAMDDDLPAFKDAYGRGMRGEDVSNFMQNVTAGGASGVSFLVGVEGTNTIYTYLPRGPKDTVVVETTFIGDFLKNNIKPKPITEKEQLEVLKKVMDSLEFIK